MSNYLLSESIRKFGPQKYLACLRRRFLAGVYTKERFAFLAAKAYLAISKPIRALTLLKTTDFVLKNDFYQSEMLDILTQSEALIVKSSPSCSLNMIVKNESNNIAFALDSIDDIMDEIVICDTGSSDGTQDIAGLYGATIISTVWKDDFSAARNEAIKASTCDWIFWMDADDRFCSGSKHELVDLWKTSSPQIAILRIVNQQDNVAGAQFMQARLFPRVKGMLFERRVHEQIMFSAIRNHIPFSQHPGITILHAGYNEKNLQKNKSLRNKPLIIKELKDNPDDPALLLSLGDCCMALGQNNEAFSAYRRITADKSIQQIHPDVFIQAHFNLGCMHIQKSELIQAKLRLSDCINLDPTRTEAYFLLGRISEKEGNPEKAFSYYLKSARITPPVRQTAANAEKIKLESIYCLARLLLSEKRYMETEELLIHSLAVYPRVVEFHSLLGNVLLEQQKLKDAAIFFMQSLSLSAEHNRDAYAGMAIVYKELNDIPKAKHFAEMAVKA
jgi:glycosyltransferase involved in cell wall biosynthesis